MYKLPVSCDSCPKTPKWYLLKVVNGRENTVKNKINAIVNSAEYKDAIIKAEVPMKEIEKENKKTGKIHVVSKPMIEGYVYVKCIMSDYVYFLGRKIEGALMWMALTGSPNYLSDEEVDRLGLDIAPETIAISDTVRVYEEHFCGKICKVVDVKEDSVIVNIIVNEREIPVEVSKENVVKITE